MSDEQYGLQTADPIPPDSRPPWQKEADRLMARSGLDHRAVEELDREEERRKALTEYFRSELFRRLEAVLSRPDVPGRIENVAQLIREYHFSREDNNVDFIRIGGAGRQSLSKTEREELALWYKAELLARLGRAFISNVPRYQTSVKALLRDYQTAREADLMDRIYVNR